MYYGKQYGMEAIRVIDRAPVNYVKALDNLPADRIQPSLWAVARNPVAMDRLVKDYGSDALLIASRHRGIGPDLMMKLGRDGIRIGKKISGKQAIILARHADEIAAMAPTRRTEILKAIYEAPGKMIRFLEKHPKTLRTAAGIAAFITLKNEILGNQTTIIKNPDGTETVITKGLIERLIGMFAAPLNFILFIIGAIVSAWGCIRLWGTYRRERQSQYINKSGN